MFLAWYDPDKKKPASRKLADAIERYCEKFTGYPQSVITSVATAEELRGDAKSPDILIQGVHYIPANVFYVGVDEQR
jgi:hypothetical protein